MMELIVWQSLSGVPKELDLVELSFMILIKDLLYVLVVGGGKVEKILNGSLAVL